MDDENKNFVYVGQTTEFREYIVNNLLTTHVLGMVAGRPVTYAIATSISLEEFKGRGYIEVMKTNSEGRFGTIAKVPEGEKRKIDWINGLMAHTGIVMKLQREGKMLEEREIDSLLWKI